MIQYNTIWDKIRADIKKEFDINPVCFLKTKIKSHGNEVTGFCDKEIPKMVSNHTCLAVTNNRYSGKIYGNRTVNLCSILNSSNQYFFGN